MTLTTRAVWLAIAAALSALFLPVALSGLALVALLAAAIVDAAVVRSAPRVTADLPHLLARGVPARFDISVQGARGAKVRVRQAVVPDIAIEPNESDSPLTGTITASRRGNHRLPPIATRSEGPLGLGRWHRSDPTERDLVVYPDMPAARRLAHAVKEGRVREARARAQLGLGTDFESVRDYQPDDDIRRVNWAATARVGRPMSNQYRVEQDRDVICLIDSGRLMAAPLGDRTRLDAAVDAVAAVVSVADVAGDHSGVTAFDSEIQRQLRPKRAGALPAVRAIFDLEASGMESDYELAFRSIGTSKRSLVMVFTDIFEESAARPLIDAVPVLTRHHHVIVASVIDTDLQGIARSEPADQRDVFATIVAIEAIAARDRIARALRHAGADVIEATPASLGTECVRRYLRAKAKARL